MYRGLYTATSAMITNEKKLDVVANNLANTNTTGYKKDVVTSESFPEQLIKKINGNSPSQLDANENGQITQERDGNGYHLTTNKGYFMIETPMGNSYTKSVRFAPDKDGYLKTYTRNMQQGIDTTAGNYVLDANGNRVMVDANTPFDVQTLVYHPDSSVIGTMNSGSRIDRIQTNFMNGGLQDTGNPLDFAINGDGFFKVQTPQGTRYTRDGSFTVDNDGFLTTEEGYYILGQNGKINLSGRSDIVVDEDGNIFSNDGENSSKIDKFQLVNVSNMNLLRKEGNNLYTTDASANVQEIPFDGTIVQGSVEGSNVDSITEMISMIDILREYESGQKVIKSYDEMLGKAVNDIGKV